MERRMLVHNAYIAVVFEKEIKLFIFVRKTIYNLFLILSQWIIYVIIIKMVEKILLSAMLQICLSNS